MGADSDNPKELDLLDVADRSNIRELLLRFEEGFRTDNLDLILSVFTDDATLDYVNIVPDMDNHAKEYFSKMLDPSQVNRRTVHAFDEKGFSTPFLGNIILNIDGDSAHCESMTLAVHGGVRDGQGMVIMRAVSDSDDLIKTIVGWRITHRRHRTIWNVELPTTTPIGR